MRPATARRLLGVAVAAQLVVLYWPLPAGGDGVPGLDKVVHALVFGAVAVTGRMAGLPRAVLAVLLLGHAAASELLQHALLPDRVGDLGDAVADAAGTLLGLLLPLPRWARPPAPARRAGKERPPVGRE